MPDGRDHLPGNKKEEQGGPLTKVLSLVPLLDLVIRVLELALKILGIIK